MTYLIQQMTSRFKDFEGFCQKWLRVILKTASPKAALKTPINAAINTPSILKLSWYLWLCLFFTQISLADPGSTNPDPTAEIQTALLVVPAGEPSSETAQETEAETSSNVIVITARKRVEYVQQVPIAMSVFDSTSINDLSMNRADDITSQVPNLLWKPAGGAGSNIAIRGISDNSFHINQVGAVGIYVDEVSLNSSVVSLFPLFDVARIEVLRGPQNTLYGRNTTGGAINYIFRKPLVNDEMSAIGKFSLGNFERFNLEAALNLPLGESAAARIAASSQQREGIFDNPITQQSESDIGRESLRAQFLLLAATDMELLFTFHHGRDRGESRRYKSIGLIDPNDQTDCVLAISVGNGCADLFGFADNANFDQVFSNVPAPRQNLDTSGGSFHLSWDLDDLLTLTSISAVEKNNFQRNEDADAGPFDIFEFHQLSEAEQLSQELRLSSTRDDWSWIGGLYYFSETLDATSATLLRFVPAFTGGVGGATIAEQDNKVWSGYGQLDYQIDFNWSISVGLRYTRETKSGVNQAFRHSAGGIVPVGEFVFPEHVREAAFETFEPAAFNRRWNERGGHLGVQYLTHSNDLLYASVARGFKGGGINLGPQQAFGGFAGSTVDPEFLTTYELGGKTSWLEDKLQMNLAIFYNDYSDQQISQVVSTEFGPSPLQTNAGKSVTKGLELDLNWQLPEDTLLVLSLGSLNAKFIEFDDGQGVSYAGNTLVQSPRLSASGLLKKHWSLGDGRLSAQLSASYIGEQEFSVTNDARLRENAYSIFDARLGYRFGHQQQFELAFWSKNIFDKAYCLDRIDLIDFGVVQCLPSEPRTFGISGTINF